MNNVINNIYSYIRLLLDHRPDGNAKSLLDKLSIETNVLSIVIAKTYAKNPKSNKFKDELHRCFSQLVNISNELWLSKPAHSDAKSALQTINLLIDHLVVHYTPLITQKQALPFYRLHELKEQLHLNLQPIAVQLKEKNINEQFIVQLFKALADLFKEGRYPSCVYAQENYLSIFMTQLRLMAADVRKKDWERRLKQLLIKYNFNHMGIYKFLAHDAKTQLNKIKDPVQLHQLLHELNVWLAQLQLMPTLAYQAENDTLKNLLLKEIALYREHFIEKMGLSKAPEADKIACNSSVNELSLFFHYHYEDGLYNYKTKKEAAIAICQHVQSKETKDISPHSLTKFDKLQLNHAAIKLYQRNRRIQERLVEDFDL